MKVTEVKTFLVHAVRQNWLFVKIETDTGLVGWGEASVEAQEHAVAACIDTLAKRSVIGEDPLNIFEDLAADVSSGLLERRFHPHVRHFRH